MNRKQLNYWGFGHVPTGNEQRDRARRRFGYPNLFKRLQTPEIMQALALDDETVALDLGCGPGYFSVELARHCRRVVAVDTLAVIDAIPSAAKSAPALEFVSVTDTTLPFVDATFDTVLASEVLPMAEDPGVFLQEIRRVLRPGGRLVVSNGAGHPVVAAAYARDSRFLRLLRRLRPRNFPADYQDYCQRLQAAFGTRRSSFLGEGQVRELLEAHGFTIDAMEFTPGYLAGAFVSWEQFIGFVITGDALRRRRFVWRFFLLTLLGRLSRRGYPGGLLVTANLS